MTCDLAITIAFGTGPVEMPNRLVCRNEAGRVVSQQPIRLDGIRLSGCER